MRKDTKSRTHQRERRAHRNERIGAGLLIVAVGAVIALLLLLMGGV